ncbi:MAG: hypothetical protein LBU51_03090, partial [Bacteroidales bacterium]|nr:hypothetical protein [Bacteroidales bacterium]
MDNSHIGKQITQYFFNKYNKPSDLNLDLTQACNLEEERMAAYHGRELLELIQNVDDAYLELCDVDKSKIGQEVKCKIEYKNSILTISNTGTYFTADTINRLCQGSVSAKSGKYIGNKGTGFRSVLNWARNKSIEIHSGEFHIRFSKKYADEQFKNIEKETVIQKQIKLKPKLYYPILSAPEDILNYNAQSEFDTVIRIEIDDNTQNDKHGILEQIDEFDSNILLFLQTITEIEFSTDKFTKPFNKKYEKENIVTITKNDKNEPKHYLLFNNYDNSPVIQHENEEKEIRLSVAIPLKDEADADDKYKLYCFFPIRDAVCPFPAILHATFLLNQSRDSIVTDALNTNEKVVQELLKFYVYIVEKEIAKKQYDNLAVKLLTPNTISENNWKFASDFGKFNVENYYLDLLKDKKFLQTVNNEYIAIIDNPKLFDSFPVFFNGASFSKLLKWHRSTVHDRLIKILAVKNNKDLDYSASELCKIINSLTNLSIKKQVTAFDWWQDHFGNTKYLPNLLKDDNNNWLQYGKEYYFLSGQQLKTPSWVKNPLLDKEYQTELFDYYKNDTDIKNSMENSNDPIERVLARSDKIKSVDFKYSDRSNIILSVNSSVQDNYQHSIEFIEWLWKNYSSEDDGWSPPSGSPESPTNYRFPTIDKTVQNSKALFFGKEYKNDIAIFLFATDEYKEFPPASAFNVKDDEKERFKNFIVKFGVLNYPKIEDSIIDPEDDYKKIVIEDTLEPLGTNNLSTGKWKLKHIKNLKNILLNTPDYVIIKWILQDKMFYNALKDSYSGNIEYKFGRERDYRIYYQNIPNYFIHIFKNTKWLEINGQKLSPSECLNFGTNTNKFSKLLPVIQEDYFKDIATKCNTTISQVKEVFEFFKLPKKITDLPNHIFYGLLLKLPKNDASGNLMKIIYREIELPEF